MGKKEKYKGIGVLTIHYGVNYGSALQAYAIYNLLKQFSNHVVIINYIPEKYNLWNEFKRDKIGKMPQFIIVGGFLLKAPAKLYRRHIFDNFLKRIKLSDKCNCIEDVIQQTDKLDTIVVGSDQVWNFDYNEDDNIYFCEGVPSDKKIYSYAASMGMSSLGDSQEVLMKEYLKKFQHISLREDESAAYLKKLGFEAIHVLDPTMVLNKNTWIKKLCLNSKNNTKKYLLVYVMDFKFKELIDIASPIAKENNLQLYVVAFGNYKDARISKLYKYCTPEKFLNLMNNAEFIVTNSFHGVAFSINFNKQFLAVGKGKYDLRIQSLLRMLELTGRFVPDTGVYRDDIYSETIDYIKVNTLLEEYRKRSLKFLEEICHE